jgi:DNA-binding MarR family transcriptional regulator
MGPHAIRSLSNPDKPSLVRDALDALRRIVRELRVSGTGAERSAGVSAAQLFVLQVLAESPGASVNDLAERTNTDQSSVSVVVRRLTAAKMVARKVSAEDARRVELRLTPAGRRMLAKNPEPTQRKLFTALERVKPAELRALARGLAAIVREMQIEDSLPGMFFEDDARAARPARRSARPPARSHKGKR